MAEALLSRRAHVSKADVKEVLAHVTEQCALAPQRQSQPPPSDAWAPDELSPLVGVPFGPAVSRLAGGKLAHDQAMAAKTEVDHALEAVIMKLAGKIDRDELVELIERAEAMKPPFEPAPHLIPQAKEKLKDVEKLFAARRKKATRKKATRKKARRKKATRKKATRKKARRKKR